MTPAALISHPSPRLHVSSPAMLRLLQTRLGKINKLRVGREYRYLSCERFNAPGFGRASSHIQGPFASGYFLGALGEVTHTPCCTKQHGIHRLRASSYQDSRDLEDLNCQFNC